MKKWYQQTWAIILLLIFFFPVGLYLMWKYTNWNKIAKICVSIFIAFACVNTFMNKDNTTTPEPSNTPVAAVADSTDDATPEAPKEKPEAKEDEKKAKEEQAKKDEAELLKTTALNFDNKINYFVNESSKITLQLAEGIEHIDSTQGTVLDIYTLAKDANNSQNALYSALISAELSTEETKDYFDAVAIYINNSNTYAEKIIKYLDNNKIKDLSDAQELAENFEANALSILSERRNYLLSQGCTEEEVEARLPVSNDTPE